MRHSRVVRIEWDGDAGKIELGEIINALNMYFYTPPSRHITVSGEPSFEMKEDKG